MVSSQDLAGRQAEAPLFPLAFRFETRFGQCVGVRLTDASSARATALKGLLAPEEKALCCSMNGARLIGWVGGRIASRLARRGMPSEGYPTLKGAGGMPQAGAGTSLSISHSREIAVALASAEDSGGVGVDIEPAATEGLEDQLLAERILSEAERHTGLGPCGIGIVELFSIKEAVYKGVFALTKTPIPLRQILVGRGAEGTSEFRVAFPEDSVRAEAISFRVEGHFLSLARVNRT